MAVTYYNQTVLGGTSYPRYPDPLVTGAPNADGLYPWSAFRARFGYYYASEGYIIADADLYAGDTINLLLFTSDIPAVGYAASQLDGTPRRPVSPTAQVGAVGSSAFFKKAANSSSDVTVAAGQVGAGYVATGSAAPNAYISTTGFPAIMPAPDSDILSAELWLWANSPNICSPVSLQNWDTVSANTAAASGSLPVLIPYSQYTQAIRDAGNIFVNKANNIGVIYQIVGLYSVGNN